MLLSSRLFRPFACLALLASIIVCSLLVLCVWGIAVNNGIPKLLGWSASPEDSSWVIRHVDELGPAAGTLQVGDRITSLNGSNRAAAFGPSISFFRPANRYSIEVERLQKRMTHVLTLSNAPNDRLRYLSYFFLALLNFVLAVWIALARPDSGAAQSAFFFFLCAARTFASVTIGGLAPPLGSASVWLVMLSASSIWAPLQWAVGFDFALRFPEPITQPRFLRALRTAFYLIAGFLVVLEILTVLPDLLNLPSRSAFLPPGISLSLSDRFSPAISLLMGGTALLVIPFILARNYRNLPDPVSRRRVRWAALGIALEILPVAIGIAIAGVFRTLGSYSAYEAVESFLDRFAAIFTAVGPVAVTYGIVKHRILGIRVVIRKGIQYLLARNVLRLILWLPILAIATDLVQHPRQPFADFLLHRSWWFYLTLISSASLSLRYRQKLQIWVDRKFFRSAYEEEIILSELVDSLQACETSDEVAGTASQKLQDSLHPSSVTVLYRKQSSELFTVGYPQDQPIGLEFRGILNERMQNALQSHRSARTFTEIVNLLEERHTTSDSRILKTLLTPITGSHGQLVGVLLLGEKKSEQKYSARDRRLVQTVAAQLGLVFEMLSLREQVREEGRVRMEILGKLDREHIQLVLECSKCGACYSSPSTVCQADGTTLGMTLPVERVVDNKYRLERRIGTGGMGAVYEATDLRLDRVVAIKVMTGRLFGNMSALRRFEREARAAAQLQHPNIIAIYDFGTLHGGGAYLVMQRVVGRSWRAELARSGHITPKRAAPWFDQLCNAVACAHSQGIVHRDLKPENLLLSINSEGSEHVTVLDFGVAKLRSIEEQGRTQLTSIDRVLGTYGYMSPEQRTGQAVDHRSDIYSIGIMTVESLTNNRPPSQEASRAWLEEALQWPEQTEACAALVELLSHSIRESAHDRISNIYDLQHQLIPLLYSCPAPLFTRSAGATGSDTETMPL
jgi:eukaryotic-like serine/threonine-protein kinase